MRVEYLYQAFNEIDDELIEHAELVKLPRRSYRWIAACFVGIVLLGTIVSSGVWLFTTQLRGGSSLPDGEKILEVHREEFSPTLRKEIGDKITNKEVKKVYSLLDIAWYLNDSVKDFSQVITTRYQVMVPSIEGKGYNIYSVDETKGELSFAGNHTGTEEGKYNFANLTYDKIEKDIGDTEYEDYIITYSYSLQTIFVWVRGEQDYILPYQAKNEEPGICDGKLYSLKELQEILSGREF